MIRIAAFYHFASIADPVSARDGIADVTRAQVIKGTILIASEGINGTIAGQPEAVENILRHLRTLRGCAGLIHKDATAATVPFHRMKVRVKREIVTMGEPDIDPLAAGHRVAPADWNALIEAPGTMVIDTRNDYEVAVGTFAGAVDPGTRAFRDFPAWARTHYDTLAAATRVAMFCTGGIRCEKATAFLKAQGVGEVYHLDGGVLKYLEQVPAANSRWDGECFVFDERVAVGPGLVDGSHVLCRACRMPVSASDRRSSSYVEGVSCPRCVAERDDDQRARYAERQRQTVLATARGTLHIAAAQPDREPAR